MVSAGFRRVARKALKSVEPRADGWIVDLQEIAHDHARAGEHAGIRAQIHKNPWNRART